MPASIEQAESQEQIPPAKVVSGRLAVVMMFSFGLIITAFLYYYWTKHTARFRPLQDAIALEFKGSMPRVEGGQRKKSLELSPIILRVTMKVFFDPTVNLIEADEYATALTKFIQKYEDLRQFDKLEYHFYQLNPEDVVKQNTFIFETNSLSIQSQESAVK